MEFLEWESLEDADLTDMEIVYDDPLPAPTITEDGTIQLLYQRDPAGLFFPCFSNSLACDP